MDSEKSTALHFGYPTLLRHYDVCIIIIKTTKIALHYVKLTNPVSFQTRFRKRGIAYRRQVFNPRHQILHEQSVAKPENPL